MRQEGLASREIRIVDSKVVLEFMRHGQKDPNAAEPKLPDDAVRLTEKGRGQAVEKGKETKPEVLMAAGRRSPKIRTGETVMHAMLANEPLIDPDASLEQMEQAVGAELNVGNRGKQKKKLQEDPRLGFDLSGPAGKEIMTAFKAGEYIPFLVAKSDQLAIETGDKISSTYLRFAGNIAEVIVSYLRAANNFNRLAARTDKYEKFGNQMERYLGTHQGVVEGFVAKVLENTQGPRQRDEFVRSVGAGFKETEGIHVEIKNHGQREQAVTMTFNLNGKKETIELPRQALEQIIAEREEFEAKVNKKIETIAA